MKNTRLSLITLATLACLTLSAVSLTTQAQSFNRPEAAVKYRKAAFTLLGTHFGRVGAMVQGKVPFDAKTATENIAVANVLSKLPFHAFPEGSETVGHSEAKPEVWKERAKFDESAHKMQTEMTRLAEVTKDGSFTLDQLKAAFGPAAQSCKSCHDNFKEK